MLLTSQITESDGELSRRFLSGRQSGEADIVSSVYLLDATDEFLLQVLIIFFLIQVFIIFTANVNSFSSTSRTQMSKKLDDSSTSPTACAPAFLCASSTASYAM